MKIPHVSFYDTSTVYYSGYYLNGFNELKKSQPLAVNIVNTLPARLKSAIQNPEWQHLLFAMALFKFHNNDKEWYFCIDTHDANSVNAINHSGGYHLPLLQCVDAYFKVNYHPEIIEHTPELKIFREKIHSISQFFPLRPNSPLALSRRLMLAPALLGFRPGLDHNQPYRGYKADALNRLRDLKNFPSLEQITARRNTHKDIDIFFVTSFRHDPRHVAVMERRHQIMKQLAHTPALNIIKGFSSYKTKTLPQKYAQESHPRLNQLEYLDMLSRAKIVIYTQGTSGCISSKFSLAMALGIAVIGEPLANNPELLATHTHLKQQFSYTDPDELVERAIHLATHPEQAHELGSLNAKLFDTHLAPRATAEYLLNKLTQFE